MCKAKTDQSFISLRCSLSTLELTSYLFVSAIVKLSPTIIEFDDNNHDNQSALNTSQATHMVQMYAAYVQVLDRKGTCVFTGHDGEVYD